MLVQDQVLPAAVARHLELQIASAQRLLDLVLRQGAAIRERDVEAVLARLADIQVEMAARESLERERTELIRRAAVFVTGDTGPMHLAAAVGTKIVALFGPADPEKTGPYATDAVVINKRLPCGPCFARSCPLGHDPPKCMTDITVDEVCVAVARRLIESSDHTPWRRTA